MDHFFVVATLCVHKLHTAGNPVCFSFQLCGRGKTCQIPNSSLAWVQHQPVWQVGGYYSQCEGSDELLQPVAIPSPISAAARTHHGLRLHTLGLGRRWSDPSVTLRISHSFCRRCSHPSTPPSHQRAATTADLSIAAASKKKKNRL